MKDAQMIVQRIAAWTERQEEQARRQREARVAAWGLGFAVVSLVLSVMRLAVARRAMREAEGQG